MYAFDASKAPEIQGGAGGKMIWLDKYRVIVGGRIVAVCVVRARGF